MNNQFKIAIYHNSRDYKFKQNPTIISDIESLLKFINSSRYYKIGTGEVNPSDNWDYLIRDIFDSIDQYNIAEIDILEYATDNNIRIISIDSLYAFPQKTNKVIFTSIIDNQLLEINKDNINFYPYTIKEFLGLIVNCHYNKKLFNYNDFIAIESIK